MRQARSVVARAGVAALLLLLQLPGPACVRASSSSRGGAGDSAGEWQRDSEAEPTETTLGDGPTEMTLGDGLDSRVDPVCIDPVCDIWPQCGCTARDGGGPVMNCEVTSTGQRVCLPGGGGTHGAACTALGAGECRPGTTCVAMTGWPPGLMTCFQYCYKHSDCAPLGAGAICALGSAYFQLCTLPCDPFGQTGCPNGTQCTIFSSGTIAGTSCIEPGLSEAGQSCASHLDCGPALVCVDKACARLCIIGGAPCAGSQSCHPTSSIIGGVQYGFCS